MALIKDFTNRVELIQQIAFALKTSALAYMSPSLLLSLSFSTSVSPSLFPSFSLSLFLFLVLSLFELPLSHREMMGNDIHLQSVM